jgi:hypothetical protein
MKTVLCAALALLAGLFVGGIGPRAELRRAQKDLVTARESARSGAAAALPLALGLGSLAAAREQARVPVPRFVDHPDGGAGEEHHRKHRVFGNGDAGAESFAVAKSAMDLRAAQYRMAFVEQAEFTPEKEQALDKVLADMNREFARAASEIAQDLQSRAAGGQKLRPREMADIGARFLDIYRKADDTFSAGLDEAGKAARDRTQFDLMTQVDLDSFRNLGETLEKVGVSDNMRMGAHP